MSKSEPPLIAFLAHSFAPDDKALVSIVSRLIKRTGMTVLTGERPEAKAVGQKVKERIDSANLFIGLLTRRHKIRDGESWTTSPWVVEEKGYSIGQKPERPVILLIEDGILVPSETGGLEGDLEFIPFRRYEFELAREQLRQVLASEIPRLRSVSHKKAQKAQK